MFKINENHYIVLVEFMEKHPQFARGQFSGPLGKTTQRKLWEELSEKLNSLGYGEKPVEKWQKTWADMKYAIKKKSAALNKDFNKTGSGVGFSPKLNSYEERILNILGKTFSEGVGSSECGIKDHNQVNLTADVQKVATNTKSFTYVLSQTDDEPAEIDNASLVQHNSKILSPSNVQKGATSHNFAPAVTPQTPVNMAVDMHASPVLADHTYGQTPQKKKKKNEETENKLYRETIEELRSIRRGVFNICDHLNNLNDTLKEMKIAILKQNKTDQDFAQI